MKMFTIFSFSIILKVEKSLMTKKKERAQANFSRFKLSASPFASKLSANQLH